MYISKRKLMNCKDAKHLLFLYQSNELTLADLETFKKHIKTCAVCKNQLKEYQTLTHHYESIPRIELDDFDKEKIYHNVIRETRERQVSKYVKHVLAVAAILLVSISVTFNYVNRDKNYNSLAIFDPINIGGEQTSVSDLELGIDESLSLLEDISQKVDKLNFTNLEVTFSFENNPQLDKIKKRIETIKKDAFFRSES
jgi:hypothetical protein